MKKSNFLKAFLITFIVLTFSGNVYANDFGAPQIVNPNKMWTIKFNHDIEYDNNLNELIIVRDSKGKAADTKILMGEDDKTLLVYPPNEEYVLGESYNLYIDKKIKSIEGNSLKESINMKFTIKEQPDAPQIYNFKGTEDLSIEGYLNILDGSVKIKGEEVTLSMRLRDIPKELLFNKPQTFDDFREYNWGVNIGTSSSKGYQLSSSYFKMPDDVPVYMPIEKATQSDVFMLEGHPGSNSQGGSFLSPAKLYIDYDENLIQITGFISNLDKEEIDYIKVFTYEFNNMGDDIIVVD